MGSPADKAQLAPGQKIVAIDSQVFSPEVLKLAIQQAKGGSEPIHLLLQTDTFVSEANIDYHDGERYPRLVRVDGTPDLLDDITKPLAKSEPIPVTKKDED